MKALVKRERAPGLWMEDVPIPTMKENEVLIKIKKTSICGTDVHIHKWDAWAQKTVPVPIVIGHEFMGEIVEVGKQVKNLKVGQRVTGEGHLICNKCPPCRRGQKHLCMNVIGIGYDQSGVFGEYFNLTEENVFVLPDTISDDLAAIFDPFGNAVHTTLSFDLVGQNVIITGAGPIGIMGAAIAKKAGARTVVITDFNDYRLDLVKKMGSARAVNIGKEAIEDVMSELGITHGFTVGLEMSGSPNALSMIVEHAQPGAKIALLGLLPSNTQLDWGRIIFKMLTFKGIYGREIFNTWYQMTALLESGLDLNPIITHHFPVDQFDKGFDVMISGNSGKVILDW